MDVEKVFEDVYYNRVTVSIDNIIQSSRYLPAQVKIQGKTYDLIGLVGFTPVIQKTGSHYISYIRKQSYWEKRDGLNPDVQRIPLECLRVFIALIVYVQSS